MSNRIRRVRSRAGWEIPESRVTPEGAAFPRRMILGAAASLAGGGMLGRAAAATPAPGFDPGRPLTLAEDATTYNNFYEFGTDKDIWQAAQRLPLSPWTIEIAGLVKTPRRIAIDDLVRQVPLQDRVYRHRCVEAWAMTVPWTGFPLSALLDIAEPTGSAKYVVFQTLADPKVMPGLGQSWYPWPYTEGLTIAEAHNDLAFIATGLYGKPLLPQNGGPIRLVTPWKYGFKSAKSLVRISFTEKRPSTFWEAIASNEYGFWANVNPAVPHPRWSQASERLIGTDERVPTQIYNGYGSYVAGLYAGMSNERLFM